MRGLPLLLLFALTLFVSATLLFVLELMIGKTLLPMLGGTPAVWNTCMVFFQALLLAGYAYGHASTAWLGVRRQALFHLGVLVLPFLTLSLILDRRLLDYGGDNPIPGLLLALLLAVGLPFFAVTTSAPLLQKWFTGTSHPEAKDPYFLYAASNLGSMVGLNGYIAVIEPWLTLANQRLLWQIGYGVLVVLTVLCAVCLWKSGAGGWGLGVSEQGKSGARGFELGVSEEVNAASSPTPNPQAPTPARRLRWVFLAFVPSSLMLGATTYMTTDIAAIPLLWVLPLDLYLLSFILVFSRLPAVIHRLMVVLLPFLVLLLVFLMLSESPLRIWWKILVHLAVLFVAAMVCHGELARDRPPTRYLTEYYLWMSFGGVLGGLFNALFAPVIFNGIVEYPLALVLACLLMPAVEGEKKTRIGPVLGTGLIGFFLGLGVALIIAALGPHLDAKELAGGNGLWLLAAVLAAAILVRVHSPENRDDPAARWLDLGLPAALGVLAVGLKLGLVVRDVHSGFDWLFTRLHDALPDWVPTRLANVLDLSSYAILVLFSFALPVVLCYLFVKRPLRFGLGIGALLLANSFCDLLDRDVLLRSRSFFGVLRVEDDGEFRRLEHGTTLHGMQRTRWSQAARTACAAGPLAASDPLSAATLLAAGQDSLHPGREPLTYFHRTGPIGQVFEAYRDRLAGRHVGLIGLGSGTLASYGQPGQKLTYYEIDPLVKEIAYNPAYFTYMQDALNRNVEVTVVLGDARLKLEERARDGPPDKFALLVIDAFSSDSIPIHLITQEALAIYLANLADDGLLAFHISNRYLDLEPVLGNLAEQLGLEGFIQLDGDDDMPGKAASSWVVLARRKSALDRLLRDDHRAASPVALQMLSAFPAAGGSVPVQGAIRLTLLGRPPARWQWLKVRPEVGVWTDDYSNLLRVFDWKN